MEKANKLDIQYFQNNILEYENIIKKLKESAITYGDDNYLIAYLQEDKRVCLTTNIAKKISSVGTLLNNEYKDCIELIANHPTVGVSTLPAFLYENKTYNVSSVKMTLNEFQEKYSQYNPNFKLDYSSYLNLSSVIYNFQILEGDIVLRYCLLKSKSNKNQIIY